MIRKNISKLLKKMSFSDKSKGTTWRGRADERKAVLMPSELIRLRNMRQRLGKD